MSYRIVSAIIYISRT